MDLKAMLLMKVEEAEKDLKEKGLLDEVILWAKEASVTLIGKISVQKPNSELKQRTDRNT